MRRYSRVLTRAPPPQSVIFSAVMFACGVVSFNLWGKVMDV